jgi:cytochrome c
MPSPFPTIASARLKAGGMAAFVLASVSGAEAAGDVARGQAAFVRQCALCHTIGPGEANRFGPNLFGVVNRQAGAARGFHYSPAFQSTAAWVWSEDVLAAWISEPAKMVPGTTMGAFQGVADRDRDDIVAYLAAQRRQ